MVYGGEENVSYDSSVSQDTPGSFNSVKHLGTDGTSSVTSNPMVQFQLWWR